MQSGWLERFGLEATPCVFAPMPITGATGSAGGPIAIT